MLVNIAGLALALLLTQSSAAPISASSEASAADFTSNVLMTSGASQFAMWVPTDGNSHSTSSITCLNILSSSTGSCNIASIDNIAAVNGYTCAFEGVNGWSGSQTGTNSSGWLSVSPPQTISQAACVSS